MSRGTMEHELHLGFSLSAQTPAVLPEPPGKRQGGWGQQLAHAQNHQEGLLKCRLWGPLLSPYFCIFEAKPKNLDSSKFPGLLILPMGGPLSKTLFPRPSLLE